MAIDLAPKDLELVLQILRREVPDLEVRVFGSRITGQAKTWSDIDLVVVGATRLESEKIAALKEAFAESDLPMRVDVLDWNDIGPSFRQNIERQFEVLQASNAR